jgi:hypothetical protein
MPDILGRPRSITATSNGTSRPSRGLPRRPGGIDREALALQARARVSRSGASSSTSRMRIGSTPQCRAMEMGAAATDRVAVIVLTRRGSRPVAPSACCGGARRAVVLHHADAAFGREHLHAVGYLLTAAPHRLDPQHAPAGLALDPAHRITQLRLPAAPTPSPSSAACQGTRTARGSSRQINSRAGEGMDMGARS